MASKRRKKLYDNGIPQEELEKQDAALDPTLNFHKRIIRQVQEEYDVAWRFMRPKLDEWRNRLKLYNNQKREKDRVGSPDMYTVHQTVLANLYDDKLAVSFGGRMEGDEDIAENLNILAESDMDEMEKAQLDYVWDWDASAFGRGLILFNDFDTDSETPIPQNIDPLKFIRDPLAKSVNGDRMGYGQLKYGGMEINRTRYEMEESGDYFNLDLIKKQSGETDPVNLNYQAEQARRDAQGFENINPTVTGIRSNYEYTILVWFTHIDGEKYIVELANDRTLLVRMHKVDWRYWPILDRPFSPIAHDWDGVSVFDLMEDKQRYRAKMLNVAADSAHAGIYPMYLFDENKIRKNVDKNFGFNKWIPVDGPIDGAAKPLEKSHVASDVQYIMQFLEESGQKALATSPTQMGAGTRGKKTKGEIDQQMARIDARYSLTAKIWGWSEKSFWKQWYNIYDRDFRDGVRRKTLRITGAFGPSWVDMKRPDIITLHSMGPEIKIESKTLSESKKARQYQQLKDFSQMAMQIPEADKIYTIRKLGKNILPKEEVEMIIPLTVDERIAKDENEKLNDNEPVRVKVEEDHIAHLRMHEGAKDTDALHHHVQDHQMALMMKRMMPQAFPKLPGDQQNQQQGNTPDAGNPSLSKPPMEGVAGALPQMK